MEKFFHLASLEAAAQQQPGWQWYAVADSAQNKALPSALLGQGRAVKSLLGATQGSPLARKSPHLVEMPTPTHASVVWEWIARNAPREPSVTVIASQLPFHALFDQLQQLAEIRLPDDTEMFFAFWDPAILGTLIGQPDDSTLHIKGPVLGETQRAILYGGLNGWWYWDRNGGLHSIATGNTPTVKLPKPMRLSQKQVDNLVEASLPDHVLYYVDLNQPHLLKDIRPGERYEYIKSALTGAQEIGLEGMQDLVNYVCLSLAYGSRWYKDNLILDLLNRVKNKEINFPAAMNLFP